jgi:hypothetical protein
VMRLVVPVCGRGRLVMGPSGSPTPCHEPDRRLQRQLDPGNLDPGQPCVDVTTPDSFSRHAGEHPGPQVPVPALFRTRNANENTPAVSTTVSGTAVLNGRGQPGRAQPVRATALDLGRSTASLITDGAGSSHLRLSAPPGFREGPRSRMVALTTSNRDSPPGPPTAPAGHAPHPRGRRTGRSAVRGAGSLVTTCREIVMSARTGHRESGEPATRWRAPPLKTT